MQVQALSSLREFSAAGGTGPHASYRPSEAEIVELLSRDPRRDERKHPFASAMDDCLMITIKGVAAGMQNTG
jgi:phosphoenolpyruvate carboxylase